MSDTDLSAPQTRVLPGYSTIARIRRMLVVTALLAAAYTVALAGAKGYCPGGYSGEGGFIDADGRPADAAPQCVNLVLRPGVLVYVFLIAAVIFAISRVLRHASDEATARRTLDRTLGVMAIAVAASVVIAQFWFWAIPITAWGGHGATFFFPFPFGAVDMTVTPMPTG